jgi:hypothetical protein
MGDEVTSDRAQERTRLAVQRVCTHVISRERHGRDGHIGLAWTGRGVGTDHLWVEGDGLHGADGRHAPLTTLADLGAFAGVDLATDFSAGRDTPPLEPVDEPLDIDPTALGGLLAFFGTAWTLLAEVATGAPLTIWPEHFDAAFVWRERANVGASPGDVQLASPYLYVGPWDAGRPGDATYWNASFGAVLPFDGDLAAGRTFLRRGLSLLSA